MERETGFEPATSTLARLHSTAELFPRILCVPDKFTRLRKGCQDPQRPRIGQNIIKWNIGILEYWNDGKAEEDMEQEGFTVATLVKSPLNPPFAKGDFIARHYLRISS